MAASCELCGSCFVSDELCRPAMSYNESAPATSASPNSTEVRMTRMMFTALKALEDISIWWHCYTRTWAASCTKCISAKCGNRIYWHGKHSDHAIPVGVAWCCDGSLWGGSLTVEGGDDKDAGLVLVAVVGKQMINQLQRILGSCRSYCPGWRWKVRLRIHDEKK